MDIGKEHSIDREFWHRKKVFVSGATGFLGAWLIKFLVDAGAEAICLIRDVVPESNFYKLGLERRVVIANGDLKNYELLDRTLNEYEIDTVFHLGAQTIVSIANRNPLPTLKSNVLGTINLLEACRRNNHVKRILVASSDKAYGPTEKLPYDEFTQLKGTFPYDVSKSCADLIAQMYYKTYGLPVCIVRCGNFYGPGDLNFNRIIPGIISDILHGREPVIRSDGSFVRSYFYIKDAAEAYLKLAELMEEKKLFGEAFNFSTDEKLSVLELVNKIAEIMRSNMRPKILNEVKNEIKEQYLSCEKAKNLLGWRSRYLIDEGLKETVDWYSQFHESKNNRGV